MEDALRDRFVCGLKAESMQKRLLTKPDLAISRAVERARGMEKAAVETREFKGQISGASKILSVSSPDPARQAVPFALGAVNMTTMDGRVNIAEPNATNVVK